MKDNKGLENENIKQSKVDEIDLSLFFKFFIRNKFSISIFSLIFFILACIYSLTIKRVWEGTFQIVVNIKENEKVNFSSPLQLFKGIPGNNDLKTEVEILKSPSIIKPIFEFVITKKDLENKLKYKNSYKSWAKNNLDVQLKTGTKVLNISYRDVDKDLIIPVLNKITNSYQNYSGRNKRRTEELTEKYLTNQINLYKEKSSKSLKAAQNFAIDQDLINTFQKTYSEDANKNNPLNENNLYPPNLLLPNVGIEKVRVAAANKIRRINIQLKKINELKDSEEIQYIGSTIPALVNSGLPVILKNIEKELAEKRAKYTEEDINIKNLIERREQIIDLLKKRTINYLKASRLEAEATMEAASRPKDVILKYKGLIREAQRDESTLINLEDKFRMVMLEKAKLEDPWELITKPTLLKNPVAPSRKKIGLLGLIIGSIIGSLSAFYKEKKTGKIYNYFFLEEFFKAPIIEKLIMNDIISDSEEILFLSKYFKKFQDKSLSLISVGDIPDKKINELLELLDGKPNKNKKITLLKSLSLYDDQSSFDYNFMIIRYQTIEINYLIKLKERLKFLDFNLQGIIIIKD